MQSLPYLTLEQMAESRFLDFTNGEMKLGDERQAFAKSVVDAGCHSGLCERQDE